MAFSFEHLPNSFEVREDLPRPNWQLIADSIDARYAENQLEVAWHDATLAWLELLRQYLPEHYIVRESERFLLLTGFDQRTTEKLLGYCEHARATILETIPCASSFLEYGPHVIVAFQNSEAYYAYISDYYPEEGEFGESVGIFISEGYPHIALNNPPPWFRQRVIAHEMCHLFLSHLPLPLWLNEGTTQVVEDILLEGSSFFLDSELLKKHRAYWNPETINNFWSGESFSAADEGQELSYNLSHIIVRNLIADYPDALNQIIQSANYQDAGNAAFLQVCEETLGEQIELFLGEGNWEPQRDYPTPGLPA